MEQRRRHWSQTPDRQFELFDPRPPSARCAMPGWGSLPQQTRHTLTGLITRLLVDHAGGETRNPRSAADDR